MSRYGYFPTALFAAKLEKIKKHDPPGHARIIRVIERLLLNPDDAEGRMYASITGG